MAGAYRVKDWHQIRQALPGAGAELVVLVPVSVLIWRCWSFWC